MTEVLNYFAYGSNLHPLRLKLRVPSSRPLGVAKLTGYALYFHKQGRDGSGKCNILPANDASEVIGVVYAMHAEEKPLLDQAEGLGFGYEIATSSVIMENTSHDIFFYQAQRVHTDDSLRPYHWYKQLVVAGARNHNLPDRYISALERVEAIADPNSQRSAQHLQILHGTIS